MNFILNFEQFFFIFRFKMKFVLLAFAVIGLAAAAPQESDEKVIFLCKMFFVE